MECSARTCFRIFLGPPVEYPPDIYGFIVSMMDKFELCFPFDGDRLGQFLVPDTLPKTEVDTGSWDGALRYEYNYRKVLPQSIISRLIVRMHPYIKDEKCWRTGVLLSDDRNDALVKADLDDAKITIAVRGPKTYRRDFLLHIKAHLTPSTGPSAASNQSGTLKTREIPVWYCPKVSCMRWPREGTTTSPLPPQEGSSST